MPARSSEAWQRKLRTAAAWLPGGHHLNDEGVSNIADQPASPSNMLASQSTAEAIA